MTEDKLAYTKQTSSLFKDKLFSKD